MENKKIKKVEIYSTPNCAYCAMAKEYFKKNNIKYIEHDVAADISKRQEMLDKTHQFGVPVILIDGQIIIGFDKARVNKILGL
jgi:glutaredoxin 3